MRAFLLQALAVAEAAAAPAKPDLSESFGQLDSDQASVSLELHGVDSPHAQVDSGTAVAAVAAAAATAAEPDNMGAGQIPNVGSFISPAGSIELHHQPWAPSLAAAAPAPGRLGVVEPLAPIRYVPAENWGSQQLRQVVGQLCPATACGRE